MNQDKQKKRSIQDKITFCVITQVLYQNSGNQANGSEEQKLPSPQKKFQQAMDYCFKKYFFIKLNQEQKEQLKQINTKNQQKDLIIESIKQHQKNVEGKRALQKKNEITKNNKIINSTIDKILQTKRSILRQFLFKKLQFDELKKKNNIQLNQIFNYLKIIQKVLQILKLKKNNSSYFLSEKKSQFQIQIKNKFTKFQYKYVYNPSKSQNFEKYPNSRSRNQEHKQSIKRQCNTLAQYQQLIQEQKKQFEKQFEKSQSKRSLRSNKYQQSPKIPKINIFKIPSVHIEIFKKLQQIRKFIQNKKQSDLNLQMYFNDFIQFRESQIDSSQIQENNRLDQQNSEQISITPIQIADSQTQEKNFILDQQNSEQMILIQLQNNIMPGKWKRNNEMDLFDQQLVQENLEQQYEQCKPQINFQSSINIMDEEWYMSKTFYDIV